MSKELSAISSLNISSQTNPALSEEINHSSSADKSSLSEAQKLQLEIDKISQSHLQNPSFAVGKYLSELLSRQTLKEMGRLISAQGEKLYNSLDALSRRFDAMLPQLNPIMSAEAKSTEEAKKTTAKTAPKIPAQLLYEDVDDFFTRLSNEYLDGVSRLLIDDRQKGTNLSADELKNTCYDALKNTCKVIARENPEDWFRIKYAISNLDYLAITPFNLDPETLPPQASGIMETNSKMMTLAYLPDRNFHIRSILHEATHFIQFAQRDYLNVKYATECHKKMDDVIELIIKYHKSRSSKDKQELAKIAKELNKEFFRHMALQSYNVKALSAVFNGKRKFRLESDNHALEQFHEYVKIATELYVKAHGDILIQDIKQLNDKGLLKGEEELSTFKDSLFSLKGLYDSLVDSLSSKSLIERLVAVEKYVEDFVKLSKEKVEQLTPKERKEIEDVVNFSVNRIFELEAHLTNNANSIIRDRVCGTEGRDRVHISDNRIIAEIFEANLDEAFPITKEALQRNREIGIEKEYTKVIPSFEEFLAEEYEKIANKNTKPKPKPKPTENISTLKQEKVAHQEL